MTPYDIDLDRNPANFQPLTPLTFLERAAAVFSDHTAIIHGPFGRSSPEFPVRASQLGSSLRRRGIKRGDTVSVLLANTPAMLECHYGVPMTAAVLNTLNTRLDAATVAFQLDHAESKVLIADREVSKLAKEALALAKGKPLVVDYDEARVCSAGRRRGRGLLRRFSRRGRCGLRVENARRRVGRDLAQLYFRDHRRPQRRGLSPPRRLSPRHRQRAHRQHGQALRLSLDAADVPLQRLVL